MSHRVNSATVIPSETLPGTTTLIDTVTQLLNSQQIHYRLADRISKSIVVALPTDASTDTHVALAAYQEALEKLRYSVKAAKAGNMMDALIRLREADQPSA
ncbi:hypothetical protein WM40_02135 [Robbsia andropogonis]|uniref:Uncharacterized protein n=1 Tax=Robbsia andropogonis TaxID=28092 RepID=A0A0F5K4H2_9BURK|nr:hypothetical protein [Robbsia andropogonis]KKB64840.1 hypothetical protein WM40_02135 [Robbsia andropogonis]MCP1119083.1 hypothetical protein [Robbsia andropogonis]MCP1129066.1 hypothetical protein [Robbsia andropogonis]